jgi:hypothetical protein
VTACAAATLLANAASGRTCHTAGHLVAVDGAGVEGVPGQEGDVVLAGSTGRPTSGDQTCRRDPIISPVGVRAMPMAWSTG